LRLPFKLCDFSETLTFDEITETLFVVAKYINNDDHSMFDEKDVSLIENWLTKNDVNKFFEAKVRAIHAQALLDEAKYFAEDVMQTPLHKKEYWN
jgi:hypothetical protein